jgi:hypothetical protein
MRTFGNPESQVDGQVSHSRTTHDSSVAGSRFLGRGFESAPTRKSSFLIPDLRDSDGVMPGASRATGDRGLAPVGLRPADQTLVLCQASAVMASSALRRARSAAARPDAHPSWLVTVTRLPTRSGKSSSTISPTLALQEASTGSSRSASG